MKAMFSDTIILPLRWARLDGPDRARTPVVRSGAQASSDAQLLRGPWREICEHPVGASALESDEALHHRLVAVEPAVVGGRHDHRIFAAHLIGEGRRAEFV